MYSDVPPRKNQPHHNMEEKREIHSREKSQHKLFFQQSMKKNIIEQECLPSENYENQPISNAPQREERQVQPPLQSKNERPFAIWSKEKDMRKKKEVVDRIKYTKLREEGKNQVDEEEGKKFVGAFLIVFCILIVVTIAAFFFKRQYNLISYEENSYYDLSYTIQQKNEDNKTSGILSSESETNETYHVLIYVSEIKDTDVKIIGVINKNQPSSQNQTTITITSLFKKLLFNQSDISSIVSQSTSETMSLPMFKYWVKIPTNTLQKIYFPSSLDTQLKWIITSIISLLTPKLSLTQRRMLQEEDNVTKVNGETVFEKQIENENEDYGISGNGNRTIIFDTEGYFRQAIMNFDIDLQGKQNEEQNGTIIVLPSEKNKLSEKREVLLSLNERDLSTEKKVKNLNHFYQQYEQKFEFDEKSIQEVEEQIFGEKAEFQNLKKETSKCSKEVKKNNRETLFLDCAEITELMASNILGFSFSVEKYTQIKLYVQNNEKRPLKRQFKVKLEIGLNIWLGNKLQKVLVTEVERNAQPQPLNYTKTKAEELKIQKEETYQIQLNQTFDQFDEPYNGEKKFKYSALDYLDRNNDLFNSVEEQQMNLNESMNVSGVKQIMVKIEEKLEREGNDLAYSKAEFGISLTTDLLAFVNDTYQQLLINFDQNKEKLNENKEKTEQFLTESQEIFMGETDHEKDELTNLTEAKIFEDFNSTQRPLLENIERFLNYTKSQTEQMIEEVEQQLNSHNQSYLNYSSSTIDLYIINQSGVFQTHQNSIEERFSLIENELYQFEQKKDNINISSIDDAVLDELEKVYIEELDSNTYSTHWSSDLSHLLQQINESALSVDYCCAYSCYGLCDVELEIDFCFSDSNSSCSENETEECVEWNYAYYKQVWHYERLTDFKSNYEDNVIEMALSLKDFSGNASQILDDGNLTIQQKEERINESYKNIIHYDLVQVIESLTAIQSNAIQINGYQQCGFQINLTEYLNNLSAFKNVTAQLHDHYEDLQNRMENLHTTFDISFYEMLLNYSEITSSTTEFFQQYSAYETKTKQSINNLQTYYNTSYSPNTFIKSFHELQHILKLHDDIEVKFYQLCGQNESQHKMIEQIRQEYSEMLQNLTESESDYRKRQDENETIFDQYIENLKVFLEAGTEKYKVYLNTSFCRYSTLLNNDIQEIQGELLEYEIIIQMFDQFQNLQSQATKTNQQYLNSLSNLQQELDDSLSKSEFQNTTEDILAFSQSFEQYVIGLYVSLENLKDQAKQMERLSVANQTSVQNAISKFADAIWDLNSSDLFPNIYSYYNQSIQGLETLNQDFVTSYLAVTKINDFYQKTIGKFNLGIGKIKEDYKKLIENFTNPGEEYNPELADAKEEYVSLENTLNQTLFPLFHNGESDKLQTMFSDVKNLSTEYEPYYTNATELLSHILSVSSLRQEDVYSSMRDFIDNGTSLLEDLEIEGCRRIYDVAEEVDEKMKKVNETFPISTQNIKTFSSKVDEDFDVLLNYNSFLDERKDEIKDEYERQTNESIKNLNQLKQKVSTRLRQKIENETSLDVKLEESDKNLRINYSEYWSTISEEESQIDQTIDTFETNDKTKMQNYNSVKKRTRTASQGNSLIDQMNKKYRQVDRRIFKLSQFLIGDVESDYHIKFINELQQIKTLSNQLMGKVSQIDEVSGPPQQIEGQLNRLKGEKESLSEEHNSFIEQMDIKINKANVTLQNENLYDIKNLNDGIKQIQSNMDLGIQQQSDVFYNQSIYDQNINFTKYEQIIPTSIGTYILQLETTFMANHSTEIAFDVYRNIQIQSDFSCLMNASLLFVNGNFEQKNKGIYLEGRMFEAETSNYFKIENGVQMELVSPLVPTMSKFNLITAKSEMDLQLFQTQPSYSPMNQNMSSSVSSQNEEEFFDIPGWEKELKIVTLKELNVEGMKAGTKIKPDLQTGTNDTNSEVIESMNYNPETD